MKQHNYLTVLFTKKKSKWYVGSWIIMWMERFPASHCAVLFEDGYVLESTFPKSRLVPLTEFLKDNEIVNNFRLNFYEPVEFTEIAQVEEELIGKWYSVMQLITIGLSIIFRFLKKAVNRLVVNGKNSLICTELCYRVLDKFFFITNRKSFDAYSLRDLYRECLILQKETVE